MCNIRQIVKRGRSNMLKWNKHKEATLLSKRMCTWPYKMLEIRQDQTIILKTHILLLLFELQNSHKEEVC